MLPLAAFGLAGAAPDSDRRLTRLTHFFRKRKSGLESHASAFLETADRNGLDWRLLPAIATLESGAGKHAPHNNLFGWKSGRARFASIPAAIETVGYHLATAPAYAGKSLEAKLRTYNPVRRDYSALIRKIMREVSLPAPIPAVIAAR